MIQNQTGNTAALVTAWVCGIMVLLFAIGWLMSLGEDRSDCQGKHAWAGAAAMIERHAKQLLLAPDSAGFAFFKPTHMGNGRYEVTSYLDTINGFGGPIRLYFTATVQCQPLPNDRSWRIITFHFL